MIDLSFTLELAYTNVGETLQISQLPLFNDVLSCVQRNQEDQRYVVKLKENYWDIQWQFSKDSALVKCLEDLSNYPIPAPNTRSAEYRQAWHQLDCTRERTHIFSCLDAYARQLGYDARANQLGYSIGSEHPLFLEQDIDILPALCVTEGLYNAIEHGTQFGELGEVSLRLVGAQRGAIIIIDDPGQNFSLAHRCMQIFKQDSGSVQSLRKRGSGIRRMIQSPRPWVGSEKKEHGFRLILQYLLPKANQI